MEEQRWVREAVRYIREYYSDSDLSEETAAEAAGTDRISLCRAFFRLTGMTCGQYIVQTRLAHVERITWKRRVKCEVCRRKKYA